MMNCNKYREMISLYIDDLLTENDEQLFLEHTDTCGQCKNELQEMQQLVNLCNSLPEEELPENFRLELHKKLEETANIKFTDKKPFLLRNRYIKVISAVAACITVALAVRGTLWWNSVSVPAVPEKTAMSTAADKADKALKDEAEIYKMDQMDEAASEEAGSLSNTIGMKERSFLEDGMVEKAADADSYSYDTITAEPAAKSSAKGASSAKAAAKVPEPSYRIHSSNASQPEPSRTKRSESMMKAADAAPSEAVMSQASGSDTAAQYNVLSTAKKSEITIVSAKPLMELVNIQARTNAYAVDILETSPQDVLELVKGLTGSEGSTSPSAITLLCRVSQMSYDQFEASLRTFYPPSAITTGPVTEISVQERYNSLLAEINVLEEKIKVLENSKSPVDIKNLELLNNKKAEYQNEMESIKQSSESVNLTITIKRWP